MSLCFKRLIFIFQRILVSYDSSNTQNLGNRQKGSSPVSACLSWTERACLGWAVTPWRSPWSAWIRCQWPSPDLQATTPHCFHCLGRLLRYKTRRSLCFEGQPNLPPLRGELPFQPSNGSSGWKPFHLVWDLYFQAYFLGQLFAL